jgi:hypothetical protein
MSCFDSAQAGVVTQSATFAIARRRETTLANFAHGISKAPLDCAFEPQAWVQGHRLIASIRGRVTAPARGERCWSASEWRLVEGSTAILFEEHH